MRALMMAKKQQGGWQPGADTLAYYPLDYNLNNQYGSLSSMSGNASFIVDSVAGKNVCKVGSTSVTVPTHNVDSQGYTVLIWARFNGFTSFRGPTLLNLKLTRNNTGYTLFGIASASSSGTIRLSTSLPNDKSTTNTYASTGAWALWTCVYKSGWIYFYKNDELRWSTEVGSNFQNNIYSFDIGGGGADICISSLIIENKEWTLQDISDYYNPIKGNYGL